MTRHRGLLGLFAVLTLTSSIATVGSPVSPNTAHGDSNSRWYWQNPLPRGGLVSRIACSNSTTCVAVGAAGRVVTTSDGGKHWTERKSGTRLYLSGIACPSRKVCYAVAGSVSAANGRVTGTRNVALGSTDGGHTWHTLSSHLPASPRQSLSAIACPSVSVCIIVGGGYDGEQNPLLVTRDGGRTWQSRSLGARLGLAVITCPSSSICYAAGQLGEVVGTRDGGKSWTKHRPVLSRSDSLVTTAFSCPTKATCYLLGWESDDVDTWSDIYATTNAARSWRHVAHFQDQLFDDMTCPTVKRCYATDGFRSIASTTTAGRTWSVRTIERGTNGIACPGVKLCYATASYAVLRTANGWQTWNETLAHSAFNPDLPLSSIACPDVGTCYAVGFGLAKTSDGGTSWKEQSGGPGKMLTRIACPSVTVCYAVGTNLDSGSPLMVETTNGGQAWSALTSVPGNLSYVRDITCPAPDTCYVTGAVVTAGRTTAVLFGADGNGGWTVHETLDSAARAGATKQSAAVTPSSIVCPSPSTCYVTATLGSNPSTFLLLATHDGGTDWERHVLPLTPLLLAGALTMRFACPAVQTCYLATSASSGQVLLTVTHNGWRTTNTSVIAGMEGGVADIGCPATDTCTVVGDLGGIYGTGDSGTTWQRQAGSPSAPLRSLACPAVNTCYAVGGVASSEIVATRPPAAHVAANSHRQR